MPRRIVRFACLLSALALVPSLAEGATNLIANPRFDAGVAGWQASFGAATIAWSPLDEVGKLASGSLRMDDLQAGTLNRAQSDCFAVTPGAHIVFGTSAYAPTPAPSTASVALDFWEGPNCSGSYAGFLKPAGADRYSLEASTWGTVEGNGTVPGAAQSAYLSVSSGNLMSPPEAIHFDNAFVYEGETCAATATVACLDDKRFRVAVYWETPDGTRGYGALKPFSGDSLRATFFDPGNVEVVLKVLDGCAVNQRYWIFAAGLTNVGVTVRVTDTHNGAAWEHHNMLDQAFAPVQDTAALENCPH